VIEKIAGEGAQTEPKGVEARKEEIAVIRAAIRAARD